MDSNKEIIAMLTVIYKKLDDLSRKIDGRGWRSVSHQTCLDELRNEAAKIIAQIV